jgi:DNA-binding CsgD family transcriptional regulator
MSERADSLAAAGLLTEAHAATLETLALLPPGSDEERFRLEVSCATIEILTGQTGAAYERLRRVEDEAPTVTQRASALIAMSVAAYYNGDFDGHVELAGRAVDEADTDVIEAAARAMLCLSHVVAGHSAQASAERERAAALVDGLEDARLVERLDALLDLGGAELYLDRLDSAAMHFARGIAIADALRQGTFAALLTTFAAGAAEAAGRLGEASELATVAEERARLAGDPLGLAWALHWTCLVALARGDVPASLSAGGEGLEITVGLEAPTMRAWLVSALARPLLETGSHARARDLILEHAGGPELARVPAFYHAAVYALLVEAAVQAGDASGAASWADAAEAAAAGANLPLATGEASRARAAALLARGASAEAATVALVGAEPAERAGAPVEAAETWLIAGRALAAAGERDRAVDLLERIEDVCAERGAELLRRKATAELRRLGRGRHRRARPAPAGVRGLGALSERERQIAVLVRQRRTNPQIAEELFLSAKTVETHLRNIFRKLDVSSRVEVAQLVEREERGA